MYHDQLAEEIAPGHVSTLLFIQRLEDLPLSWVGQLCGSGPEVDRGSHDRQTRRGVELSGRLPQFRQQQQREEERGDHVDSNGRLVVFGGAVFVVQDAGVFDDGVKSRQVVAAHGEVEDRSVGAQVEGPDLDLGIGLGRRGEDLLLGRFAFGEAAAGEDQV